MSLPLLMAGSAVAAWLWLLLARGRFWLAGVRDDRGERNSAPESWPSVVAVVPARDEAEVIAASLGSLLAQDYPGVFRIVLVDDASVDSTAAAAAALVDPQGRLRVLSAAPLPAGWTGKLWAMRQGVEASRATAPDYLLFTDADIAHDPDNLRRLVERAEHGGLALTSLMARLSVTAMAERALIPAFVFFFALIYPFAWVNDPARAAAAAAGGCMLARREALERAGGLEAIAGEIIDDCALAARLKQQGPIWLGLTSRARSLRPYDSIAQIAAMVSRSAYAQLGFSPLALAGALAGLGLAFLAGPVLTILSHGWTQAFGATSWALMTLAFQPMLRFYRLSPLWGLALPAIALAYGVFTMQSAIATWRGRGGMWKGRAQAMVVAQ